MQQTSHSLVIIGLAAAVAGYFYFSARGPIFRFGESALPTAPHAEEEIPAAHAAKFDALSKNGNSTCSAAFKNSVASGTAGERLQGSCCSAMDLHRYVEQVEGLTTYANIPEIPSDPYDIDAELAKQLTAYYDVELSPAEQQAYDYAMANSNEKGPCCCKCWRWYVYGGLGKLLIQKYHFTGEQVTEVWNLSDGCGGAEDHAGH